jgi:uncharacterized repeat protein (TIGR03806 family)
MRLLLAACLGLTLAGCDGPEAVAPEPRFHAEGNPPLLSDWGQVHLAGGELRLAEGVTPYDLNTALFTDYAHKLRTIWLPEGMSATYREDGVFDFPVGAVITKTFYYPRAETALNERIARTEDVGPDFAAGGLDLSRHRLIETRILVRRETGWAAIPYVWNEEQTEARLRRTGQILPLTLVASDGAEEAFNYVVPNVNQCASCHAPDSNTRELSPIGPAARHLNRDFPYAGGLSNQIAHLAEIGYLTGAPAPDAAPRNAAWTDAAASVNDRARAWLDINCSHCHSPVGPADTSGLFLETDTPYGLNLGVCKLPIAAGGGTGDRRFGIVPGHPEESILSYRIDSNEADVMMPEIGRSTTHAEAVDLINDWISELEGDCD